MTLVASLRSAAMRNAQFMLLLAGADDQIHGLCARSIAWRAVSVLTIGSGCRGERPCHSPSELARIGYADGRNIAYEIRAADGDLAGCQRWRAIGGDEAATC